MGVSELIRARNLSPEIPTPSRDVLKGRVVFVTGAAGRLGRAASVACARHGATVILSDRNLAELERLYDEILTHGYPEPALYPIDFAGATEKDYEELARTIDREFGVLHGLLHNAAAFAPLGPVSDIDVRDWCSVLTVNLSAPFILTRVLLGLLQKSADGAIAFTSDSSARKATAYWGVYGVSKIAVEGFAGILAHELESAAQVRVNILIPGPVDSPLRKLAFPAENPARRVDSESLEKLYIHLLGPGSRGQNGQVFNVTHAIE
ncbi:MAG: SDR family NAD(P)-dependent oxidoreductase [Methylococcaceae bacterium]|nr:SDR family NAD(P)-dependent oxidoreductase [Methylococcaceae bacterium]